MKLKHRIKVNVLDLCQDKQTILTGGDSSFRSRLCKSNEAKAVSFSKPRTAQTTTLGCGNKNLHDVIAALIPDYKPKMRYKVVGEFDAENRVIYYDMSAAEVSEFRAVKD